MSAAASCGTTGAGFINPELYAVAANPAEYAASFDDITVGNNDPFGSGFYPATKGYDMASGLGSPKVTGPRGTAGLALYLCAQSTSVTTPTVTGISPSSVFSGGGTVTVSGTGFKSGATSDIAGVQIGTVSLPPSSISALAATSFKLAVPPASRLSTQNTPGGGPGRYYVVVTSTNGSTSKAGPNSALQVVGASSGTSPFVTGVGPSGANESAMNGASPVTTTIYGSGFAGATEVTFGGRASPHFTVNATGNEIRATVPAFEAGTTVCRAGDKAATDVCQVEVVVKTATGSSAANDSTILPPYTGAFVFDPSGVFETPAGCGCETAPQPSEFDYFPTPHIHKLTADVAANGKSYANENGGTVVTLTGTGFDVLGLEWIDEGPPNENNSDFSNGPSFVSGTELQFVQPSVSPPTATWPFSVPIYVQTLASPNSAHVSAPSPTPSNFATLVFAPTPTVSSVSTGRPPAAGLSTGGTSLTIEGSGFTAATVVTFTDEFTPFGIPFSGASTFSFTVVSSTEITLKTPSANAGIDDVQVCTTSGCSTATPKRDTFVYYPPGDPSVASSSPRSGPAKGGTKVTIHGTNLGFVIAVRFGNLEAKKFANVPALLDSGNTNLVTATAPPGKAGTTVSITLETLESSKTGKGFTKAVKTATFRVHQVAGRPRWTGTAPLSRSGRPVR